LQRIKIRCNIDAPDPIDVHTPTLTCEFSMTGVSVLAMSPTGIPCGTVIALSGECCIGCNSAHLPGVGEVVPELVGRDVDAALAAPAVEGLVDAAAGHGATAAVPEPQLGAVGLGVAGAGAQVAVQGAGGLVGDLDDPGLAALAGDGDLPAVRS
jgi:hypothetical protein